MNRRLVGVALTVSFWGLGLMSGANASTTPHQVEIRTSLGTIVVELDETSAPRTTQAFLSYVQNHVYQDSCFHQLDEADIQGGRPGPHAVGYSKSGNFSNNAPAGEFNLKHVRGAIGLARTVGDCNPEKTSNSTQFYIMSKDFPKDDGNYSIFGHVIKGMEIVDRIAKDLRKDQAVPVKFDVVVTN